MNTKKTQYQRYLTKKNKIGNIEPFQRNLNIIFKVIKKGYTRKTRNGSFVSECLVADDTGSILLTVWDEDIAMLEPGEYFALYNGYVNIHRNKLKLNKKRYGDIEPHPNQHFDVNLENNLSKKKYDRAMTLLKSKSVASDAIGNDMNIAQDNVKIVGMDI